MLHNFPWFELEGRAAETGWERRSVSGHMDGKNCAASGSHIYHPGPGVREREKEERKRGSSGLLAHELNRACVFHEVSLLETHLTYFSRTWSERSCLI